MSIVKKTGSSFMFVVLLLLAGQAQAAVINWTGAELLDTGTLQISTSGTLVKAINYGGFEATAGGVTFEDATGQNPFANAFPFYNPVPTTGDPDFDSILNDGSWQIGPGTITYGGLTSGMDYLVQIFSLDSRPGGASTRTMTVDAGTASESISGAMGNGWVFNGMFTADALTQDVTMTGSIFGGQPYIVANASQLREVSVPEPAMLSLLGIGLLALGFMGCKRRVA